MAAGLLAAAGAAGCSLAQAEDTGSSPDEVVAAGDTSALLKSTLVLQGGCTAAKVGPKHLLVAARCVTNNPAFVAGKVLVFASAASAQGIVANAIPESNADPSGDPDSNPDEAAPDPAAAEAGAPSDAGSTHSEAGSDPSARNVTISEIQIHPSYVAKCTGDLCGFNKLAASDSPDIAVIILKDELATVPSIPIDLDPVGQSDQLLVVNSGCASLDAKATMTPKASKTIAVPAKSVVHVGSAYEKSPDIVTRLATSYVVTAGAGWRSSEPRLCKTDMGSPVFRGGSAAVAGVTANYTTYADAKLPVTTHHTRVDAMSRFKIGDWLSSLGVATIHSCSETAGGCTKHSYDGGAPMGPATEGDTTHPGDGDGGVADATVPTDSGTSDAAKTKSDASDTPDQPANHGDQLPSDPGDGTSTGDSTGDDFADAAAPKKSKSSSKGGCSAAPGSPAPTGEMFLGLGLVLGAAIARRRRAR